MKYEEKVKETYSSLRDFQKVTVDYLVQRMFDEGQGRMLVADEVGLGKTWIAKGVIAQAYARWCKMANKKSKHFNVYYICSNQQLFTQNLDKVNFTGEKCCIANDINRISMLALKPLHENEPVQIYALTPDTSFSNKSKQGIKEERYILYAILQQTNEFNKVHLSNLLRGNGVQKQNWNPESEKARYLQRVKNNVTEAYIKALKTNHIQRENLPTAFETYNLPEKITTWEMLKSVVEVFDRRKAYAAIYNEIIGCMRKEMADVCLKHMDADLFVMDEFQRYSQLIDNKCQSEQDTIAQKIFGQSKVKVLMLSATPFKAYTNQYDEQLGEQHYKEFKRVLEFLYEGRPINWQHLEENRARLYSQMLLLNNADDKETLLNEIQLLKKEVEDVYSRVIVRTEKLIASNDPNAMIVESNKQPLNITKQEVAYFVHLDKVFKTIYEKQGEHAPSPVNYAKSAPYAMSFLREYKVGEKAQHNNVTMRKDAFVDLNEVNKYNFPRDGHWPHEKLRLLMKNMKQESKLLWCPPSLPYYPCEGAYKGQEQFTKTLVFSAWKLVPKMIATLVSYEAERQTIGKLNHIEGVKYFADKRVASQGDKARKPTRRLVPSKKGPMTTLLVAYPCITLAKKLNPAQFIQSGKTLKEIVERESLQWENEIKAFCNKEGKVYNHEDSDISWAYPMICDSNLEGRWKQKTLWKIDDQDKNSALVTHNIPRLKNILTKKEEEINIPKNPTKKELYQLSRLMATMSIGSPGVCAYRSLCQYYPDDDNTFSCAFKIGCAFIDLFNKPESTAIVELLYAKQKSMEYWQKVIQYCADGNLQAVLDEYVFMLYSNYTDIQKLTKKLCSALTIRTSTFKVDDAQSFGKKENNENEIRYSMRSHFAAPFGVNPESSQGSEERATGIREAFNSPFKPFVLATTSIGQEGLDFHWYCRKVMHWNLPNNPIDFEQREGRVNRYRGKVVRQRVAEKYHADVANTNKLWDTLFELAEKDKADAKFPCDLVPNWHFESKGVSIERVVPLYKFSQDIQRYEKMLHVLGLYRLTFGQPRQEELVEALNCEISAEELDKLLIDLCPMRRAEGKTKNKPKA
jgi:DEAD/DEAH box helicase:helicase